MVEIFLMSHKENHKSIFPAIYLSVVIIVYTIIFSTITILRHETLATGIYDLGIFDQALWNTINGRLLKGNVVTENILGIHFFPILIFIAPLYWVWADPRVLLLFQSFILAIGALPLYLLAKEKLKDTRLSLSLSTAYLLSLHLHGVNLFDFHPEALVVPLVIFAFFFLEIKKYILFSIFLIFSFMCREEMSLMGFMTGLYIAISKKRMKVGVSISILSIITFLVITYIVFPYFGSKPYLYFSPEYKYFKLQNRNFYEIIRLIFIPHKIKYIVSHFLSVMGFPLLSGWGLFLVIPQMIGVLLSSSREVYTIGFYQYSALIIPFIFVTSVYGISNLSKSSFFTDKKGRFVLSYVVTSYLIILGIIFNFLWFSKYFKPDEYRIKKHHRLIDKIKGLIPPDASLIVNNRIGSHFSQRKEIYNFEDLVERPDRVRNKTDYITVDTKTLYKYAVSKLRDILSEKEYGVMYYEDGYIVLKKGYNPQRNDEILASQ